jgi:hypothetical protein
MKGVRRIVLAQIETQFFIIPFPTRFTAGTS